MTYRRVCKECYIKGVDKNRRENYALYMSHKAKRRAQKKGATPLLTPQERKDVKDIYDLAAQLRALGIDVQVDHVDPLVSSLVAGLHTPYNLRILPTSENMSKSNKFSPYGVDAQGNIYQLPS